MPPYPVAAATIAASLFAVPDGRAFAADVARGGELYLRTGSAPLSCGDDGACHGPDPRQNLLKIRRGANDAARIESAIARNLGGMGFLGAYVEPRDVVDVAAWLGAVVEGRVEPTIPPPRSASGTPGSAGDASGAGDPSAIAPPFNVGYGGCSVASDTPLDAVLAALTFGSAIGVARGRRRRAAPAGADPAAAPRRAALRASVAGAVVGAAGWPIAARAIAPAALAPDFTLPGPAGEVVSLAAHRGRVVWLDFWASWCAPCRRSFPWMNAMHARYGPQGLAVVAVNLDARDAPARRFLAEHPADFTVLFDPTGESARRYGVRAMPTSVLIGADGRVVATHAGFRDDDATALEASIRDALARAGAPAR